MVINAAANDAANSIQPLKTEPTNSVNMKQMDKNRLSFE